MKIVRTDGGGEFFTDERLKIVRSTIFYYGLESKILKLNDHKGILNVFWEEIPTEYDMSTIENIWESFNENLINHFFVNYSLIKEVSL